MQIFPTFVSSGHKRQHSCWRTFLKVCFAQRFRARKRVGFSSRFFFFGGLFPSFCLSPPPIGLNEISLSSSPFPPPCRPSLHYNMVILLPSFLLRRRDNEGGGAKRRMRQKKESFHSPLLLFTAEERGGERLPAYAWGMPTL